MEKELAGDRNLDGFDRSFTRSDIKTYENQKKIKSLATAGLLGSLGLTGASAYKKKIPLALAGIVAAAGSGYLRGKASEKEHAALERVKRRYEVQPRQRLINLKALLPDKDQFSKSANDVMIKEALVGSLGHALWQMTGKALIPFGIDLAAIPWLAKQVAGSTRKALHVAAKQEMGKPLASGEKIRAAAINVASAVKDKAKSIKNKPIRTTAEYATSYFGPYATAAEAGPMMGKILKEVEKVSPRYADMAIDAIPGGIGQKVLINTARRDAKKFIAANRILQETRTGKFLKNRGGSGGAAMLKRYLEDPKKAIKDAKKLQQVEDSIVRATQFTLGAGAAASASHLLGGHNVSEEDPFWKGFKKKAQGAPGTIKPIPSPDQMKRPAPALSPIPSLKNVNQGISTQSVAGQ